MQETVAETPARRIGKYDVLGELGHGGMAVVYRARDTQLLREVAIKILHPHLANEPESRKRFLREAQAAARLRHPNIVEVFDFSVESDRESFMVTELLDGPTLRKFAEQNPGMPAEIAACIGIVLCDALECAHKQGVVHRDVKPDNILLHRGGVLKLTDFGIAHVADGNGMTVTGQVLGSPAHMAPEQIEGRSIDARADLFAAGTVLYVLGVGRLPFEAPYPHALLRKILDAEYPDPVRSAPQIGHRFGEIIRRCMERLPDRRYASAAETRDALRAFVREIGWEQPEVKLREYFADPAAFGDAHRKVMLDKLPQLGAAARKAGRLPDALGYFNRALALDPSNVKVLGLVRGISRRRRVKKAATAVGVVVAAAALSAWGVVAIARSGIGRTRVALPVVMADRAPRTAAAVLPSVPRVESAIVAAPSVVEASDAGSVANALSANGATVVAPVTNAEPVRSAGRAQLRSVASVGTARTNGHSESSAPLLMQPVSVSFTPQGGEVRVDGHLIPPNNQLQLSVGPPHTFSFQSSNGNCGPLTWTTTVSPDPAHPVVRLRHTWNCAAPTNRDGRTTVAAP